MKPKQRQTLKEILALWRDYHITSTVAIRRIGRVFVTTEDDFTSDEGPGLGGCTSPLVAA